ncbi:SusC/RagA family TonB-linked outer membrane protein [Parapedobacter deserti]|uniref:SusC/RagA family TonB-linked outer membrane protein n=1 Tax=Parapedobacter deserti TaxID=1912957 RepID=A0ABV7JPT4_9SPHI
MKTIIACILHIIFIMVAQGQTYIIKGRVLNAADSLPIPNAGIRVADIGATRTDGDGRFEIKLMESRVTLRASHIGFQPQELKISLPLTASLTIMLHSAAQQLDEVVVSTGYEEIPLERATGSFEKIDNALLNRSVSMDVLSRIENVTSGIHFDRRGASFNNAGRRPNHEIYVHGISTLRDGAVAGNSPLIILDNFPYEGDINNINPNDIESLTILKDAAAASIWGAKAGNGVIVITSKKARYEQPIHVSFSGNVNITDKPDLFQHRIIDVSDLIDVEKYLFSQGFYSNQENSRAKPALSPVVEILIKQRDGSIDEDEAQRLIDGYRKQDTRDDMLSYTYRQAVQQQYAWNMSGGSAKHRFLLGLGYDNALPSQVASKHDRMTLRLENSFRPSDKLELSTGIRWTNNRQYNATLFGAYTDNGFRFPYVKLADEVGNPLAIPNDYRLGFVDTAGNGRLLDWQYRPLEELQNYTLITKSQELLANFGVQYKLTAALRADVKYQYVRGGSTGRDYYDVSTYYARNLINRGTEMVNNQLIYHFPLGGILKQSYATRQNHNTRALLNYAEKWHGNHAVHALAGVDITQTSFEAGGFNTYGYDDELLTYANNIDHTYRYPVFANLASTENVPYPVADFANTMNRFVSYFSNASYTYKDRYTVTASARRDASNLFGVNTNNKWTPLWSVGASWAVHHEEFFSSNAPQLLKLRATYGFSGNVDNSMSALTTIYYSNNAASTGVDWPAAMLNYPPNPALRWEKVGNVNIGVDFKLVGARLFGSVDFYQKFTNDLLQEAPLDPTTGRTSMTMNVANTRSRGVDANIRGRILVKSISWDANLLFSYNNSWITKSEREYANPRAYVSTGSLSFTEGTIAFPAYSYKWAGLDPQTGEPQGYLNGEISKDYRAITSNQTTLEDLVFHGSARPLIFGSLRNDLTYKGVSISANISWKFKYFFRRAGMDYTKLLNSRDGHIDFYHRWKKPGDEQFTHVPAFSYPINPQANTFYQNAEVLMERGDHIRLQDIRIGYAFSGENERFKSAQFFICGNNLGILWRANKLALDPDMSGNIPFPRSYSLGLNINF